MGRGKRNSTPLKRFLHCGKQLSFLQKLSNAEFCSDPHRDEFQRTQGDMALRRLLETKYDKPAAPAASAPKPERRAKKTEAEPVYPEAGLVTEGQTPVKVAGLRVPAMELMRLGTSEECPQAGACR